MKKQNLPVSKKAEKYILTCTGLPYDGVDDEFQAIITQFVASPYVSSLTLTDQIGTAKVKVQSFPGEPLYHILQLVYGINSITNQDDEKYLHLQTYLCKWIDIQNEKLMKQISLPNGNMDIEEASEFQMSATLFDKQKDYLLTYFVIKNLRKLLLESNSNAIERTSTHTELINSLSKLEKMLRIAYSGQTPLIKKKNLPVIVEELDKLKYDACSQKIVLFIMQDNYILAEAYANKCRQQLNKLNNKQMKFTLNYLLQAGLGMIARSINDIDMLLDSLNSMLNTLNEKKKILVPTSLLIDISDLTEFAGAHFEKLGEFDIAIKYYIETHRYSKTDLDKRKSLDKLNSLSAPLVKQISALAQTDPFSSILRSVKCYSKDLRMDLYFTSEKYADLFSLLMSKNNFNSKPIPNHPTAVAILFTYKFNVDVFKEILSKVVKKQQKDQKAAEHEIRISQMANSAVSSQERAPSKVEKLEGASGSHPRAATTKSRTVKVDKSKESDITVSKWKFLEQRQLKPLERVEFQKTKKVFDPNHRNGIVTLRVNGLSGRWFACINPRLKEEIENIKKGEGVKLLDTFNTEVEFFNDLCVPCFKEMQTKSAELGVYLPYVFKMRLFGCDGLGNVRIYAKIIDTTPDGKKLVAFTAINPNSHAKHTRPICFDMPEEIEESLPNTNTNLLG